MSITGGMVDGQDTAGRVSDGPKVYVASPLGFTTPTRFYYDNELLPRLRAAGFVVLDPWEDERGLFAEALGRGHSHVDPTMRREELARVDAELGARNVALIRSADGLLAILDGTDVDSGTASEVGFAYGLGKPVVGLRTDFRQAGENDGCTVNLQVEHFVRASGGTIAPTLDRAVEALGSLMPGHARP
jgi:nucleoside 2-deoxyribosyltransferase